MKKLLLSTCAALVAIGVVAAIAWPGPEPSVSLYWYEAVDPTAGAGICAPQYQLLIRTDAPSLYAHTGTACTAWTKIGSGTSSGGTVTSITCSTGLTCTPNPIVAAGTIAADGTAPTGTGTANTITKWTGTSTIGNSGVTDDGTTVSTTEGVSFGGSFTLTGSISPAAITGTTNDYSPAGLSTTNSIRQALSGNATLTGIVAQNSGFDLVIQNLSSTLTLTLANENTGSMAANRFTMPNTNDWVISPNGAVWLRYSGTTSRWRVAESPNFNGKFGGLTMISQSELDASVAQVFAGAIFFSTATTPNVSGGQNNYAPFPSTGGILTIFRIATTGATTITGQAAANSDGRQLYYENVGTGVITITNQDASSTAANRFVTPSGGSITLGLGATMHMYYDLTQARWVVDYVSTIAGSSGTTNTLAAWTSGGAIGNTLAPVTDDGTTFSVNGANFQITEANGNTTAAGTLTADGGNRVFDVAGTGLTSSTNTVSLNITPTTCSAGQFISAISSAGAGTCTATSSSYGSSVAFGTGVDGVVTCDGTNPCFGISPSSSVYALTRAVFPSSLTVSMGATIRMQQFYMEVSGTLTNNGSIIANGNSGALGVAGAAFSSQWFSPNLAGGAGGSAAGGSNGAAAPAMFPAIWGVVGTAGTGTATTGNTGGTCAGGGGGGSTNSGGNGGTNTQPTTVGSMSPVYDGFLHARVGVSLGQLWTSGSGGGGGGAAASGVGGGGGAGGGQLFIAARAIAGTGTISANGGNGAGGSGAGLAGGGAGGSGGVVLVVYETMAGATQTITATGGTHGAGNLGGGNGGDGGNCFTYLMNLSGDGT